MEKVSLLRCNGYAADELKEKILQSLRNIGFNPNTFKDCRVALKPNLLLPAKPESAINTHHEFFRAMVQIVKAYNGIPVLIESPAFHSLHKAVEKTPYAEVVKSEGVEVANSGIAKKLTYRDFEVGISEAFFDVDFIVNLPKFKTHGLTYITCAVKNQFGAMPGLSKSRTHMRKPMAKEFSRFLVNLSEALKLGFAPPKKILHVVDAIMVQEGEGPGPAGTPRMMNAIIAGRDATAVDCVAADMAGLKFYKVPTITRGLKQETGINSPDQIEIIGDNIETMRLKDFIPTSGNSASGIMKWAVASKRLRNLFRERPFPMPGKCTLCLQCKKICPAEAIQKPDKTGNTPKYNYNKCIRCYCCMEVCPEAAIVKKKGKLQWMMAA